MDKVIPFNKGIRRQPSLGEDGELSELVNLVPKHGELVNVRGLKEYEGIKLGENDVYVGCMDSSEDYNVYIALDRENVKYFVRSKDDKETVDFVDGNPKTTPATNVDHARIFGLCLCLYSSQVQYFILNGNEFVTFDELIGDLEITFGLESTPHLSREFHHTVDVSDNPWIDSYTIIAENFGEKAVSYTAEWEGDGYFINPFMVRYAYRMFDGTLKCHSAPVLMPCGTKYNMIALDISSGQAIDGLYTAKAVFSFFSHRLYYRCLCNKEVLDKIKNSLSYIVDSLDIYICPINMVKNVKGRNCNEFTSSFSFSSRNIGTDSFIKHSIPRKRDGIDYTGLVFVDEEATNKEIKDCNTFFFLKSIKLKDVVRGEYKMVDTSAIDLSAISTQPSMSDEYGSDYRIGAKASYMYNGRMIRGNLTREYANHLYLPKYIGCSYHENSTSYVYMGHLLLEKSGRNIGVLGVGGRMIEKLFCPYIFIQDPDATAITIENGDGKYRKINLTRHEYLHGAYAYLGMDNLLESFPDTNVEGEYSSSFTVRDANIVQMSEVNAPFTYLAKNEVEVGNGQILGFSTAAKALSEGQFGQFPVYVFCTDGIWALDIAEDGSIRSTRPISRDVCNNPDSITQIDGAVVFTTKQGLMMIQGSDVVCLSKHMEGHNVNEDEYFESGFFEQYGEIDFDSLVIPEDRDFREILETCCISYDYVNRLLRIFPRYNNKYSLDRKYYIYSLDTKEFSTSIFSVKQFTTVIPEYPSNLIQIDNMLYRPSEEDDDETKLGLLLTRPILLNEPFALKKIQDLRLQYSHFDGTSECKVVMYASKDGYEWIVVPSLRRSSFKYYRFAVITRMKDIDALTGMILRYELDRTNKLR